MDGADVQTVKLLPDTVWMFDLSTELQLFNDLMESDKEVFLFTVKDLTLVQKDMTDWSKGLKMEVVLERSIQAELTMTYLPSLGLLIVTYITIKFKREYFEGVVGVNLTLMLLLFTIFTSKIAELPPTSYIKMIDIWLILCMLVPFIEVVLITIIEHYKEENDEDKHEHDEAFEKEPRVGIPIVESGGKSKVSPEAGWQASNSSPVSSITRSITTLQVAEKKEDDMDGEQSAPKDEQVKTEKKETAKTDIKYALMARWTRKRKREMLDWIGETEDMLSYP